MDKRQTDRALSRKCRYLKRFTLQSIRTFKSPTTIKFTLDDGTVARWTVILGENGTGKTSLLQYLAGMTPVQDVEIRIPSKQSEPPAFRPLLAGREWFGWNASNVPRPWAKPAELSTNLLLSNPVACLEDVNEDSKDDMPVQMSLTFDQTPEGAPQIRNQFTATPDPKFYSEFRIFGYGAGRHVAGPASPYMSSDSFLREAGNSPVHTLFNDDQPLISPEQWLLSLDHISRSEGDAAVRAKHISENACTCLANALPGIDSISVKPFGIMEGEKRMTVLCETPYGKVPFSSLSLGYRTTAAWLTDFLKRMHESFAELDKPAHGPAVVIIDEFDLHLHPAWQREVMKALSSEFPNTQFIVTAHSPLVVQAAGDQANVVVLRRVQREDGTDEVLIDDNTQFTTGWRIDQILESDLYGLSPRSSAYTALIEERMKLRQKDDLTVNESNRLDEIERKLNREAPPGLSGTSVDLLEELKAALSTTSS